MIIVGIDVGINGAAAALVPADNEGPEYIADAIDLPTMPDGETKNQIDERKLAEWLRLVGATHVVIENVRAMPSIPGLGGDRRSMGAASAFRFGVAAGQIRTTVRLMGIDPIWAEPSVWKRASGLKGPDKEQSRQLALQHYPMSAYLMKRKKDHQRAEAMLIARWGARKIIIGGSMGDRGARCGARPEIDDSWVCGKCNWRSFDHQKRPCGQTT